MSFKSSFAVLLLGLCTHLAASSPTQGKYDLTVRVQQCRGGCLGKYATRESLCVLHAECSACWDECALRTLPKINKSIRETWALRTVMMLQQDSLVLVDVAWEPLSTPNQCLVTWEVSGGGLMGNLLTESFNVQLSLWPDTKYRVQVTCKNKDTGAMSRSLPLTIDTSEATISHDRNQQPSPRTTVMPTSTVVQLSNSVQETVPSTNTNSGGVPFDDQSNESINQHTNFIFNWHQKNSDISKIESLSKPDLNILRITSFPEVQNPFLFDMIAGSVILIVILILYVCVLRAQRRPNDKTALIEDDSHSYPGVSIPVAASLKSNSSSASTTITTSSIAPPELCKNPAICSRNALKV